MLSCNETCSNFILLTMGSIAISSHSFGLSYMPLNGCLVFHFDAISHIGVVIQLLVVLSIIRETTAFDTFV